MWRGILLLLVVLNMPPARGAEDLAVPWQEFKALYRESIERQVREALPVAEGTPWRYALDEAEYRLRLSPEAVEGSMVLSGRAISGVPAPIPLLGAETIITGVQEVKGGTLLPAQDEDEGLRFLPSGSEPFHIALRIALPTREDQRSWLAAFAIPSAIRNVLYLERTERVSLVEAPGLADKEGVRHFANQPILTVRFEERAANAVTVKRESLVDIDAVSTLRIQGNRLLLTTWFAPRQLGDNGILLRLPTQAQYLDSALRSSWVRQEKDGLRLALPKSFREAFSIQCAIEQKEADKPFRLTLPTIADNSGSEGNFILVEPEDGRAVPNAATLSEHLPAERLSPMLASHLEGCSHYSRIPATALLEIRMQRFTPMKTPPIVLDRVELFAAFEESGGALSVLRFAVPSTIGGQMSISGVPGAEIWSLRVNGEAKTVYTRDSGEWIIPLPRNRESSLVELALLVRGEKLGLQGKLATMLPAIGLPARQVLVGIALPERVQLFSLDGPVSSVPPSHDVATPQEFVGRKYYFASSFNKGTEMSLTLQYKEFKED